MANPEVKEKQGRPSNADRLKTVEARYSNVSRDIEELKKQVPVLSEQFAGFEAQFKSLDEKASKFLTDLESLKKDLSDRLATHTKEMAVRIGKIENSTGAAILGGDQKHAKWQMVAITGAGILPMDKPMSLEQAKEKAIKNPHFILILPVYGGA